MCNRYFFKEEKCYVSNVSGKTRNDYGCMYCAVCGAADGVPFYSECRGDFCPMHIPVLLCGLLVGWPYGLLCGLAGPLLSSLLTGMPAMGYLPCMMVELGAYGLLCGLFMKFVRTGKIYVDLYISLVGGLVIGRVIAGLFRALIFRREAIPWQHGQPDIL